MDLPDPGALPDDAFGRTVRSGRDLIVKTSSMIGPDAPDPAMRYSGNGLDCQSCHLKAGTQRFGLPLAGIWGLFPQYIARENEVRTLEERINGCMERSMNGNALPLDGPEMKAMLTFIRFISARNRSGRRWTAVARRRCRCPTRPPTRSTGRRCSRRPAWFAMAPTARANVWIRPKRRRRGGVPLSSAVGAGQLQRRRGHGAGDHRGAIRPCQHAVRHDIRGAGALGR